MVPFKGLPRGVRGENQLGAAARAQRSLWREIGRCHCFSRFPSTQFVSFSLSECAFFSCLSLSLSLSPRIALANKASDTATLSLRAKKVTPPAATPSLPGDPTPPDTTTQRSSGRGSGGGKVGRWLLGLGRRVRLTRSRSAARLLDRSCPGRMRANCADFLKRVRERGGGREEGREGRQQSGRKPKCIHRRLLRPHPLQLH